MKYIKTNNYIKKEAQFNLPGDSNLPPGATPKDINIDEPSSRAITDTYPVNIEGKQYDVLVNYEVIDYSNNDLQDLEFNYIDIQRINDEMGNDVTREIEIYEDEIKEQIKNMIQENWG